jgi:hypothetical protein
MISRVSSLVDFGRCAVTLVGQDWIAGTIHIRWCRKGPREHIDI